MLHNTLSAGVDLTAIGEIAEEETDDALTEFGLKFENDEPIAPQKSTQDKNPSKAAKSVIRYNSSKLLQKTNVLGAETSLKPQYSTNQISQSSQNMAKDLALPASSLVFLT